MAIKGITYSNQRVSAADHGSLFGKLFTDGIITGCAISHRLATCTIGQGAFIIAGRLTNIIGNETFEFASGHGDNTYARIVGVVDTNQAAPKGGEGFAQFAFRVEYAATADGFPELTVEDVNDRGTKYEVEWAVFKIMNDGSISGDAIRSFPACDLKSAGESGDISFDSFSFKPLDDTIPVADAVKYNTDPTDSTLWELAILVSGTLKFKKNPGAIEVFAVGGGEPGVGYKDNSGGNAYGGNGGNGGELYSGQITAISTNNPYSIVIGGSGEDTTWSEFGITARAGNRANNIGLQGGDAGRSADSAPASGKTNAGKGLNGKKAFPNSEYPGSIYEPNRIYGSSGGGGGIYGTIGGAATPANGGATTTSEISSGSSEYGAGASYGSNGTQAKNGRANCGQGGGGRGGNGNSSTSLGGSGIMIIRKLRTTESA